MEDFTHWKERGNKLFQETCSNKSLPACVYQMRMCQVIQFYNQAIQLTRNVRDRASIWKNLAITQFRIGERIFQPSIILSNDARKQREQDISYFLKESVKNFGFAIQEGAKEHGKEWIDHLMERRSTCTELLWNFLVHNSQKDSFPVLAGRLHQLCWNMDEPRKRSEFFQRLAQITFKKAVEFQESNKFKESLQLLHDNHFAIEEAKKFHNEDLEDLEQSNYTHLCIGLSAMDRERGDTVWKIAISGNEELKMDLVWDAVDCYIQSIISARDKCLESEAIAHCKLGEIYGSFFFRQKSREHYKMAVNLEMAMRPKNLTNRSWYKEALIGLEKYQQEDRWKETKEREKIRAPIRAELKEELDELKKVSGRSASELVDLIYAKHPPKRGTKSESPELKPRLKQALLHFHPDKQDLEASGLKWMVLTEEITVLLTYHYAC